jgi:hypothetical protein
LAEQDPRRARRNEHHGNAGFDTFTQQRTVMRRGALIDPAIRYPNFKLSLSWARRLYRVLLHELRGTLL